jgi:hypothetical protein
MKTMLPVGSWIAWEMEDTHRIVQYMGNGIYSYSVPPPEGTLVYMGESINEEYDFTFIPKTIHRYEGILSKKRWGYEYSLPLIKNIESDFSIQSEFDEKTG